MTMMKLVRGLAKTTAAIAFFTAGAYAEDAPAEGPKLGYTITIGGTSNYLFRGISLSDNSPAAQGALDLTYGLFYGGVWASNTAAGGTNALGPGFGTAEIDFYGGIKPVWGPVTFDFGAIAYTYFWGYGTGIGSGDLTYYELKAGLSGELFKGYTVGATYWVAPSQTNSPLVNTIEGYSSYTFPQVGIFTPTYSSLIGYSDARVESKFSNDEFPWFALCENEYTYWNTGLSLTVEKFTMDFRYWGTSLDGSVGGYADDRFVVSAKVVLP